MIMCQVSITPREEKSPGERAGEMHPLKSEFCHLVTIRYFSIHLHSYAFLFKEELENNGLKHFFFFCLYTIHRSVVVEGEDPFSNSSLNS